MLMSPTCALVPTDNLAVTVASPVIVVAPAAKVPVVDIPVVSRAKAPVVFILLLVTSTFPNVPPKVPVTTPDADIPPDIVVSPAPNVPDVETFSSPKLIEPVVSVIEPPETVIVPAVTFPVAVTLFVTVNPFDNDISPPIVISLEPRLIPLALVDVILPLLIDISPISADIPTDKSAVIPASPVIVVSPTDKVPVVESLLLPKLIAGPEETTEPEPNVRFPTLRVLATVATPSIFAVPLIDNLLLINLTASTSVVVVILPPVEMSVVPNETVPSVSVILPLAIVVLPTLNEPAVTLFEVDILLPIVSVSVSVVIFPVVNVISPKTLPVDASIIPLISNPFDTTLPPESYITALFTFTTPGDTPANLFTSFATNVVPLKMLRFEGVAVKISVPMVRPVIVTSPALKSPPTATFPVVKLKISILDNWILFWSISKLSTETLPAVTFLLVEISSSVSITPNPLTIDPTDKAPVVVIVPAPP